VFTSKPQKIVDAWNGPGDRDGKLTVVTEQDNALHPSDSKWAFEHWYFDAHLDTGHVVVAFLQKRRPEEPPGSRPVVELIVYYPDGTRRQVTQHHPKGDFSASAERCEVRIGESHAHSDYSGELPVHQVHAVEEDLVFDLTFTNETPSWMPGSGLSHLGANTFGWVVPGPRARVTGAVTIDGERLEVTGRGYHDHNWGVGNMPRVIERWHWGRLYTDDFSLLYATVKSQKRFGFHESRPLMLAEGGDILLSTGEVTLTEGPMLHSDVAHRDYPQWLRLQVEPNVDDPDPIGVDLRLDVRRVIHAHDLLDDVPVVRSRPVKPLVRLLVGHPGYFRFDSEFELTVTRGGVTRTETGRTLHELVALH
jgi:hypothetical protein